MKSLLDTRNKKSLFLLAEAHLITGNVYGVRQNSSALILNFKYWLRINKCL